MPSGRSRRRRRHEARIWPVIPSIGEDDESRRSLGCGGCRCRRSWRASRSAEMERESEARSAVRQPSSQLIYGRPSDDRPFEHARQMLATAMAQPRAWRPSVKINVKPCSQWVCSARLGRGSRGSSLGASGNGGDCRRRADRRVDRPGATSRAARVRGHRRGARPGHTRAGRAAGCDRPRHDRPGGRRGRRRRRGRLHAGQPDRRRRAPRGRSGARPRAGDRCRQHEAADRRGRRAAPALGGGLRRRPPAGRFGAARRGTMPEPTCSRVASAC